MPQCGSSLRGTSSGEDKRYQCGKHIQGLCDFGSSVRVSIADRRVLEAIREQVLSPKAIAYARAKLEAQARSAASGRAATRAKQQRERSSIDARIVRLVEAIELGGGDVSVLTSRCRELEARRQELDGELRVKAPWSPSASRCILRQSESYSAKHCR